MSEPSASASDLTAPSKRGFLVRLKERLAILGEFWDFLKVRKKWWLGPIVLVLLLLALLIVLGQGSAVAPFIYTVF